MYSPHRRHRYSRSENEVTADDNNFPTHLHADDPSSRSINSFVSETSKKPSEDYVHSSSMRSVGSSSVGGSWSCRICTYRNSSSSALVCGACLLPRGSIPLFSENEKMKGSPERNLETAKPNRKVTNSTDGSFGVKNDDFCADNRDSAQFIHLRNEDKDEHDDVEYDFYEESKVSKDFQNKLSVKEKHKETEEEKVPEDMKSYGDNQDINGVTVVEQQFNIADPDINQTQIDADIENVRNPFEEQQYLLKQTDDEIEAIRSEMHRLEERQFELIERRMMLMTNMTFLEQEKIGKKKNQKSAFTRFSEN